MRSLLAALLLAYEVRAAEPTRSVKTNEKVLEFVAGRIEDFYFDPAGPPGWPDEWQARFAAMAKETDVCAFYVKLDDLLKETGVSHFSAEPPRDEPEEAVRAAFRRLRLVRVGAKYHVRVATEALATAGVKPGDELLAVCGRPAAEFFTDFGCGLPASRPLLKLEADGRVLEVELPLDGEAPTPREPPIVSRRLEGDVHYLRVRSFGASYEAKAVAQAIRSAADARALLLDLRGNPGGRDLHMRDLLGHLYERSFSMGTFVNQRFGKYSTAKAKHLANYLRTRSLTPVTLLGRQRLEVQAGPPSYLGPLSVLADPYTASAAEMAAGTLQRTGRAKVVGERTAGAVLMVLTFDLPDGGSMSMPAATFVDDTGRPIEGTGVAPDVEAPPSREDLRAGRDTALDKALALTSGTSSAPPEE